MAQKSVDEGKEIALVCQEKCQLSRLVELATYDDLTKILNRKGIISCLESEVKRVFRHKFPLSLLLIDLDHFKRVNDTHGHIKGDYVLKISSKKMKDALRQEDYLGRLGGDEFLAVLPHTDFYGAMIVAKRLVDEFSRSPIQKGKVNFSQTISIGVSTYTPGETTTSFLERADSALYQSKTEGRCRFYGKVIR